MRNLSRRTLISGAIAAGTLMHAGILAAADKKAIVIVYSRTGNTLKLAQAVQKATGADFLQLEIEKSYAAAYSDMVYLARSEKLSHTRREIKTKIPDLSGYDAIYLGTPYWWGGLSVPMWTFLSDHPMEAKTIYPFITSGSSPAYGAIEEIKELCPKATVKPEFHATSSELDTAEDGIRQWAQKTL